jgi:lactoylglutathione lyase
MIDPSNFYHTGYAVKDLAVAQEWFENSLGLEFAPIHYYDPLRLWVPGKGWTEERIRVTYSRKGPHHIELLQGEPGGFYDPAVMRNTSHMGAWVEDVGVEVRRLLSMGWELLAAKGTPEEGYGEVTYLIDPMSNMVVELLSVLMKPRIFAWFDEQA